MARIELRALFTNYRGSWGQQPAVSGYCFEVPSMYEQAAVRLHMHPLFIHSFIHMITIYECTGTTGGMQRQSTCTTGSPPWWMDGRVPKRRVVTTTLPALS